MKLANIFTGMLVALAFCMCGNLVAQTSSGSNVTGDFDADGDVDMNDINFYVGNFGSAATEALAQLDLNDDGLITVADLQIHVENYVQTSNGGTGTFLGDLNLDGAVDVLGDAFALVSNLNSPANSYAQGDIDLNGTVNVLVDAFILIENLGRTNTAPTSVTLLPGTDQVQAAIDQVAAAGGGVVYLLNGNHFLTESITPESNVDIIGEGFDTVLNWHSSVADTINEPMIHSDGPLTDVHFQDFKLRGSIDPSDDNDKERTQNYGILLEGGGLPSDPASLELKNISLCGVEVRNFGSTGVHIKGADTVDLTDLKCNLNGFADIDLYHNIYLLRTHDVLVEGGTFTNSPSGHGMRFSTSENVTVNNVRVTGNADHGIHLSSNDFVIISNSFVRNNAQNPLGIARNISDFGNTNLVITNTDY